MRFMLNIAEIMKDLAKGRPIFHSEADFQHALAWHIHKKLKNCQVRLEHPFQEKGENRKYLDVWLPTASMEIAIELKYRTRELKHRQDKEFFDLRNQAAQPTLRYDFIKDISRLEQATGPGGLAKTGFAIFLTNDPPYWRHPQKTNPVDIAFRLDKEVVEGKKDLDWTKETSPGTKKNREKAIKLKKSYKLKWEIFSNLGEKNNQEFRYLAVEVPGRAP